MSINAGVRNRANGAVKALCNDPECSTSVRLESAGQIRRGGGGERALVTGGAGFFGFRLGKALAMQGISVILLDLHQPRWELPDGAVFLQGDVRDYDTLYKACAGVDCIFHTASYGMSGPEQLRKELVESVNVGGTNNVINVCCERGVSRLVYTSTVNVVFAGKPIEDGDEDSVPCVPLDKNGQAYFINDGESVNVFDWMTPLFERLGYTRPLIRLPVSLVYSAAFLMEQLHVALRPFVKVPLLLTRNEVRNISVSHTFRIEKARQELGFSPKKYTLADSVDQYLQSRPDAS
ncbi:putative short-chain dehydrogenase/reductase family 42E member 2, partial [Clarias magur]